MQLEYGSRAIMQKVFVAFNRLRAKGFLDEARLRKALGYLQRNDQSWREEYSTTIEHCDCPDSVFRPDFICKHRIAKIIEAYVEQEVRLELAAIVGDPPIVEQWLEEVAI